MRFVFSWGQAILQWLHWKQWTVNSQIQKETGIGIKWKKKKKLLLSDGFQQNLNELDKIAVVGLSYDEMRLL